LLGLQSLRVGLPLSQRLDENEAWRDVGLLLGGTPDLPVLQHVTSACHHCLEPACLTCCPVRAYEKDLARGSFGIVDDQAKVAVLTTVRLILRVPNDPRARVFFVRPNRAASQTGRFEAVVAGGCDMLKDGQIRRAAEQQPDIAPGLIFIQPV